MNSIRTFAQLLCFAAFTSALHAQAPSNSERRPSAPELAEMQNGEIKLSRYATIRVTFPTDMVPASEIDVDVNTAPLRLVPPVPVRFMWKSQVEGTLWVDGTAPSTRYEIFLAEGLKDAAGKPLDATHSLGVAITAPFSADIGVPPESVGKRPSMWVSFSHEVRARDLAETAWFQDRESRQRYPVEVQLDNDAKETTTGATLTPRTDLPGGRTFDLVIDGIADAVSGTKAPQPFISPVGETKALAISKIAAFNYPMHRRRIAVEFSEPVDPAEGRKIKIEPAVPKVEYRVDGESLWIEGDFELETRYRVTVPTSVIGKSGFALGAESRWSATFQAKKPSLIFPTDDLHQRSRLGLGFSFMQVNTGDLKWKLAKVPPDKLLAITQRVREFTEKQENPVTLKEVVDESTGWPRWKPTELLIETSHLESLAEGAIPASEPEKDTLREIVWKPANAIPAGTYLLEVTGKLSDGKVIGNRALITFTEYVGVQKRFGDTALLHVLKITDGHSVPGVKVQAVSKRNELLGEATTDARGFAVFRRSALFPATGDLRAEWFVLETPEGRMLQNADADQFRNGGNSPENAGEDANPVTNRVAVVADRPLYRPGQSLHFKVFAREVGRDEQLRVPHSRALKWNISDSDSETVAEGSGKLDDYGGFDLEYKIAESARVGQYTISVDVGDASGTGNINVQEFRPPPFLVSLEDLKQTGEEAGIRISSVYFHGAVNAGAKVKWTAAWSNTIVNDSRVIVTDVPRMASSPARNQAVATGEGVLDAQGRLTVKCASPFNDGVPRGWYEINWSVEVTALDAQTITQSAVFPFHSIPNRLALTAAQVADPDPKHPLTISIDANAYDVDSQVVIGQPFSIDLYRVSTKTVKEQISPFVYRYRNSTSFEKRQSLNGKTPSPQKLPVDAPGEYLITLRDPGNRACPVITQFVTVAGVGDAEFPVADEETIKVSHGRADESDETKRAYRPGETAVLSVQAPFAGIAWMTVETDHIIDTLIQPLAGNSGRLELPIKPEYAPNAQVTVYLLSPGGDERLPAERFGSVEIAVRRPEQELKVTPVFASKTVQPKEMINGYIQVSCEDRPVKDADLTVYAVDESILDAGEWHEPPLRQSMYPERPWQVSTRRGLERLSFGVDPGSLHQKGFIIGGGEFKSAMEPPGPEELRTNFPPLAFWKTRLRSDKEGRVPFSFTAPDALTKYRVIALAQTKQHQFGTGSDWVEISKPLQIEPALPRFLRVGDQLELRAIVRQKTEDSMAISVRCSTNLTLHGPDTQTQDVARNVPAIFRFRASVGEFSAATIRFETLSKPGDSVEISLPVHPPTLLRKEAVFGTFGGILQKVPAEWTNATGSASISVSTSPWLPKLNALPLLLEYPHGCFEQITSRVLAYTVLSDLLAYVPEPAARDAAYKKRIEDGIDQMAHSLTSDGYLPYWPGGEPEGLPTVAGLWSVRNAQAMGLNVPPRLVNALEESVGAIAADSKDAPKVQPSIRAYSLMVLAESGGDAATLEPIIREMYLRRGRFDDEARALLAMAMHRLKIMPSEKAQLLREIDRQVPERAFDPETFSSTDRVDALRALAFTTADPSGNTGKSIPKLRERISQLLDSAESLSTQESFWTLYAFKALNNPAAAKAVNYKSANPQPIAISSNGLSASWSGLDIRRLKDFALRLDRADQLACQVSVQYRTDSPVTERNDRGFRIERVVKNLSDKSRMGSETAPFHLGDQILITYRLASPKLSHYVVLDSELPAGLETVNPNIASIARTYSVPQEKDSRQLDLSYSEMRDRTTCLYFNRVDPGAATYSVLARATCAGVFRWPATQVTPMYDNRFSGLSPSSLCYVSAE